MPHVLALTQKSALVQCEYLAVPKGAKIRTKKDYDVYKERVKRQICDARCGIERDAGLRNPPIQLICVYLFPKDSGSPKDVLAKIEQKANI